MTDSLLNQSSLVAYNYTQGVKRTAVSSLKPMFNGPDFPNDDLRGNVFVGLEYPLTEALYPAIYITFHEQELRNVGVGHIEELTNEDGSTSFLKHWLFTGSINFNILALSPDVRDELGSILINILAFGDVDSWLNRFQRDVLGSTYIDLQYLTDIIHPMGEVVGQVPWASETEMTFATNYAIDVLGEFYSHPYTGDIVTIENVNVFPYRKGDNPHWQT